MKREELKELGLTDEQLGSVMALHGKTITGLNAQINSLESERDQFKEQVASNQSELDVLKESAKGNEELTQKFSELQSNFDKAQEEAQLKLSETQKDYAIRLALKDANVLDEDVVISQLDKDMIKVADGDVQGLKDQLGKLQETKGFLFRQEEPTEPAKPTITTGGNPKSETPDSSIFKEAVNKVI